MPNQTQIKYLEEPRRLVLEAVFLRINIPVWPNRMQVKKYPVVKMSWHAIEHAFVFHRLVTLRSDATPKRKTGPVEMRLSGRMESNATKKDRTRTRSSFVVVLSIADEMTEKISRSYAMEERRMRDGAMGDEHSANARRT